MRNNNKAIIKKITGRALSSDKKRNFFIVAAIILTTFMIASVFSIGVSYYESINMHEKHMQGSVSHMAFSSPTQEQYFKLYSLDYVKTIGLGVLVAQTDDVPELPGLDITYVDKTQWEEMLCPAFTNIIGRYPEHENEIMLSRHILGAMGISEPEVGMEIPLSYTINETNEVKTETFKLSCIYTEYSHITQNSLIFTSPAFALNSGKLMHENMIVNIIFKNSNLVSENIEILKNDLAFAENQEYTQSPAFNNNYGNITTYAAWIAVVVFMMFTGYLLIYNVMYISISKNVRFFGMLKILGTTPKQVRRIVIGQILRLCLIGLPVGCAASAVVSLLIVPAILSNSGGFDMGTVVSFSPVIYIGAILFAGLTALIGAAAPAKKAANISPVEAMNFTGGKTNSLSVHLSANGKPHKIAFRNIFRDRNRAVVVMLSLFLGVVTFTSIITIVVSMDIDKLVDSRYDYDFSFSANNFTTFALSDGFVNEVKEMPGVKELAVTSFDFVELSYSEKLEKYIDWSCEKYGLTKDEAVKDNMFMWASAIKGIDPLTLHEINKTLSVPIDTEAFERGEVILINVSHADLANCFTDVTELNLKFDSNGNSLHVPIDGVVFYERAAVGNIITLSDMEILVSNTFLRKYSSESRILYLDINVESGHDEQVYNTLDKAINPAEVSMDSRFAGRKALQEAKTVMFILGGGVSAILALIGIFNFINVISVGVMVRKRELAALESIGMSKKQMRSMLRNEGLGYAIITLLFSMTFGNLIVFALFRLFKNIADYAQFTYPFAPVAVICAVIVMICLITPEVAYSGISKMTLVERLREAE